MKLLVLGGTREARKLCDARELRRFGQTIFSLAGVTQAPVTPNVPTRFGGFGGVEGLKAYLETHRIDAVIDGTHPFAEQMSRHAAEACRALHRPILRIIRPAWTPTCDDQWRNVPSIDAAEAALGDQPQRILLSTGRQHVDPFRNAMHHRFFLRCIDAPASGLPRHITPIIARPPFSLQEEIDLLTRLRIDVIVTKNSGASAVAAKLKAARRLRLSVIMVARPTLAEVQEVATISDVLSWLDDLQKNVGSRPGN